MSYYTSSSPMPASLEPSSTKSCAWFAQTMRPSQLRKKKKGGIKRLGLKVDCAGPAQK